MKPPDNTLKEFQNRRHKARAAIELLIKRAMAKKAKPKELQLPVAKRWQFSSSEEMPTSRRQFTKEDASAFFSASNFGRTLIKKGYESIGSGMYSAVYAKPDSDKVIKVTQNDDGWINYAYWGASKGLAGAIVPKVYSYKKINIEGKTQFPFHVSVVERFEKEFHKIPESDDKQVLWAMIRLKREVKENPMVDKVMDSFYPGLSKFQEELGKKYGYLDLHMGNFMLRKDGSFAYTDPITSAKDNTNFKRLKEKDFTSVAMAA